MTWDPGIPTKVDYVDPRGYVRLRAPGHALADSKGRVGRHRVVCWVALGMPRTSWCHWCGYVLPWKVDAGTPAAYRYVVNVDHLNEVPGDDRAENLVPSCAWCNVNRSWAQILIPECWDRIRLSMSTIRPADRPNLAELIWRLEGFESRDDLRREVDRRRRVAAMWSRG